MNRRTAEKNLKPATSLKLRGANLITIMGQMATPFSAGIGQYIVQGVDIIPASESPAPSSQTVDEALADNFRAVGESLRSSVIEFKKSRG